jgi:hypothetical protein
LGAHAWKVFEGERGEIACGGEQQFVVELFYEIRGGGRGCILSGVPLRRVNGRGPGLEAIGSYAGQKQGGIGCDAYGGSG